MAGSHRVSWRSVIDVSLPSLEATRYAAPLREGGSLPAVVETADGTLWVVKFRGAGQGAKALVAELVVGLIARHLALPVPDLAIVHLDPSFGRTEGDPEIQELLRRSHGPNVGLRFLDGAFNYDPVVGEGLVGAELAADVVWLDALVSNVDRTPRNPNLLVWRSAPWLIDHGAALTFHHHWPSVDDERARRGDEGGGRGVVGGPRGGIARPHQTCATRTPSAPSARSAPTNPG